MNTLSVIAPYKHLGMWVFDDERVGLVQEPFVSGADTFIDRALAAKGIEGEHGFRLVFSMGEFPGYDHRLTRIREGEGGNWYYSDDFEMEAWLCPALLEYFDEAPAELYARFEPMTI